MERDEFKIIVKGLKAVYTYATFLPDKDAFDVWYGLLKDLDYKTTAAAVQKYMQTQKTPPTIADIREQYASLVNVQEINAQAAWALVSKAVRNGTYGAQEEFDKLPEDVREALGSASRLTEMATSEDYNEGVESSNFMRVYNKVLQRRKEINQISPSVRVLVEKCINGAIEARSEDNDKQTVERLRYDKGGRDNQIKKYELYRRI